MPIGLETRDGSFFLEGRRLMLLSGALHYFRVVPEYWRDRLLRLKACGLNTLETYIPWNLHEEVRGEFNFEGMLDLRKFLKLAQELGLHVLLRPGPYICSEWDFGGLPSWLLRDPGMKVRSPYKPYLDAVDRYFAKLLPLVTDLQYSRGGPIIAFQIENEYGSYDNDIEYKTFLKEIMIKYGVKELLFTSDNKMGLVHGVVPGVLMTSNFQEVEHAMFQHMRAKQPDLPLMVMEFWSGWFDHWGSKHTVLPLEKFEKTLRWILEEKSSVNFYMLHGGTNFGFMNGANEGLGATNEEAGEPYAPDVTSYDYDAPIAENGDLMPKFYKIKELLTTVVQEFVPESIPEPPAPIPRVAYGKVKVTDHVTFKDLLTLIKPLRSVKPIPMEMLDINNNGGQSFGFTLYRKCRLGQGREVCFKGNVKDRGVVFLNGKQIDTVLWSSKNHRTDLPDGSPSDSILDVLVENLGRVNYADFRSPILNQQRKGLQEDVLLDEKPLENWEIFPLEFKKNFIERLAGSDLWTPGVPPGGSPSVARVQLNIAGPPHDTYIHMKGWSKGVVFVNSFNLGRYWDIGPQETLYIPAPLLKAGTNQIFIFELHNAFDTVEFLDHPELGETMEQKWDPNPLSSQ